MIIKKSKNQRIYSETKFYYKNNWKSTEMERALYDIDLVN